MAETTPAQTRSSPNTNQPFVQRWLAISALVLRILLWPLRRLYMLIFPTRELDGLNAAVCAKAVQHFVQFLQELPHNGTELPWKSAGFDDLQAEAVQSHSLVLIYLHSPLHHKGTEVCRNLLLQDPVAGFLQNNALQCLGVSIHTGQGAHLARRLGAASYPLLCLLQPSQMTLLFQAQGPALIKLRPEHLVQYLNASLQRHQTSIAEQEVRRIQREEEQELRRQQDAEYQATLAQDQERERLAREERERQEQALREQQEEQERMERQKQERMDRARALLRTEPTSGGTRVRFVLPSGKKLDRRFENDETVEALKAFLILHFEEAQLGITNIGLSTTFPRKTFDKEEETLEEAGISPQAVLMVQDLDA